MPDSLLWQLAAKLSPWGLSLLVFPEGGWSITSWGIPTVHGRGLDELHAAVKRLVAEREEAPRG